MTNAHHPANVIHSPAVALQTEGSVSRNMASEDTRTQTEEAYSDAELQIVRVKLDIIRGRMGTAIELIPAEHEYDMPPDASDSPVQQTVLEKTLGEASLVSPATEMRALYATKSFEREGDTMRRVETSENMSLSSMTQRSVINDQQEAKNMRLERRVFMNIDGHMASQHVASTAAMAVGLCSEEERSISSDGNQGMASVQSVTSATPSHSPVSVRNRTSSEDGFVSTPEARRKPRENVMKPELVEETRTDRAVHLSLNHFLISELEVYLSHLLRMKCPKKESSNLGNLARVTGVQLYLDHQRGLMDFDDEWKRSHANSYRGYSRTCSAEELVVAPANIHTNPFQLDTANGVGPGGWTSLLNQVRASSTKSTPAGTSFTPHMSVQEGSEDLSAAFVRGSNGIIVGSVDCHQERLQISAFMAQIPSSQNTSALYVVVAAASDLARWEKALLSEPLIRLYPYWGGKHDRLNLLQLLSNEYFSSRNLWAHVLLTSYEVFMEDISILTSLHCQLSIIDIPRQATDQIAAIWPQLLSLRCRQRLLLCLPEFEVDARRLLHFLVPELFSSRRKLLAWNSAAFHIGQVYALCGAVEALTLISNEAARTAFMLKVAACTVRNCEREAAALATLNQQGIVGTTQPSIIMPVKHILSKKARSRASGHIPAEGKIEPSKAAFNSVDSQLTINAPSMHLKPRTGGDGTPGSRQRIGRCGSCTGCLAEDCMKCGHCQDMKKYGGPGLRKQSCKHRKCLNPKIWGLASRKRKRKPNRSGVTNSAVKESSELDDDFSVAYSSAESDGESLSIATHENGGSDDESLRHSDAPTDSPCDLLLPASDTLVDDNLSLSDLSARSASARSRIMRCGLCEGCQAPDCLKCPHCLDMKKYGGPGLRKQTCKIRKCKVPKVVKLNQARGGHDQYVDEMGNVVYSCLNGSTFLGSYEGGDSSERPESTTVLPGWKSQRRVPSVIQECERYVKPQLVFACVHCSARFSSSMVLNFHAKVEHLPSTAGRHVQVPTALEQDASRMFTWPRYQSAMINAQRKQHNHDAHSRPLGYAKLEVR
uniref:CXXC-type domain-containing protein n=1 Tax=Hyaloperonospora arabidopsidis (strain Emoy2) TaxID=559515 RepID=M4B6U0_HYAAE